MTICVIVRFYNERNQYYEREGDDNESKRIL